MSQFLQGQSGNPNGRPSGALNKRTRLAQLLEPHAEELIEVLVKQAKEGDPNALRLCVERLIPKVKNESPTISLPQLDPSQGDTLPLFRKALVHAITQQDEISMDSLALILQLCSTCRLEEHESKIEKSREPYSWKK